MSSIYHNVRLPAKVTEFRLKLRLMIDQRHSIRASYVYQANSNVLQFPTNRNKVGNLRTDNYLEACQALLGPVGKFFYAGPDSHFSIYDLDAYLNGVSQAAGRYLATDTESELNADEQQRLKVDVIDLQTAGFEHTSENYAEVLAAYGEQLIDHHKLLSRYAELADGDSQVSLEVKKAYADVKGMIEQAKKIAAAKTISQQYQF